MVVMAVNIMNIERGVSERLIVDACDCVADRLMGRRALFAMMSTAAEAGKGVRVGATRE